MSIWGDGSLYLDLNHIYVKGREFPSKAKAGRCPQKSCKYINSITGAFEGKGLQLLKND